MPRRVVAAGVILTGLVVGVGLAIVQEGFTHVLPASMLRWSRDLWQQEMYAQSIRWYVTAHEDALDAALRWRAAAPYLDRMQELQGDGELEEAFENCIRATEILDGHDDEGQVSHACTRIALFIDIQR